MDRLKQAEKEVLNWLQTSDNIGISSKALGKIATTDYSGYIDYPYDNSDFYRCVLFKKDCPTAFEIAKEKILAIKHKIWTGYFEHWSQMENLLNGQIAKEHDGNELYNLMKAIQHKRKE